MVSTAGWMGSCWLLLLVFFLSLVMIFVVLSEAADSMVGEKVFSSIVFLCSPVYGVGFGVGAELTKKWGG